MGDLALAEAELRKLIRRYPMFADAEERRSADCFGDAGCLEAKAIEHAAGLDRHYRHSIGCRRSVVGRLSQPEDLMAFMALTPR